jgi:hypothetical protein
MTEYGTSSCRRRTSWARFSSSAHATVCAPLDVDDGALHRRREQWPRRPDAAAASLPPTCAPTPVARCAGGNRAGERRPAARGAKGKRRVKQCEACGKRARRQARHDVGRHQGEAVQLTCTEGIRVGSLVLTRDELTGNRSCSRSRRRRSCRRDGARPDADGGRPADAGAW